MYNKVTLNREFGNLFGRENWDYFSTLTHKWTVGMNRNRRVMDGLVNSLKKQGLAFSMVWVSEWHRSGSSTHNHLLTKGVDITLIDRYWSSHNLGRKKFNSHLVYEKDKGANFYLAKYLDKEVDYDYVWTLKT